MGFSDRFDPEYATLTCRGWYKVDGVKERIGGKAWLCIAFHYIYPEWGEPKEWRQVILNLKIRDTYAGLAFSELENNRWEQQNGEWTSITIPAARIKII